MVLKSLLTIIICIRFALKQNCLAVRLGLSFFVRSHVYNQSAGVERGRNGFRKNKSTEKNPESEEDLLQHRTDGTDAFDTLYIGCEKFPQHDFYGGFVGGVR